MNDRHIFNPTMDEEKFIGSIETNALERARKRDEFKVMGGFTALKFAWGRIPKEFLNERIHGTCLNEDITVQLYQIYNYGQESGAREYQPLTLRVLARADQPVLEPVQEGARVDDGRWGLRFYMRVFPPEV